MTSPSAQHVDFQWMPRRLVTLEHIRRRSRIVRVLRLVFTAGAAISIGVLAGPVIGNAVSGLADGRKSFEGSEIVTMINPRFTGRDAGGKSYVITADEAQARRADSSIVDLVNPTLVDQAGSRITAPEGTFDQTSQTLDLFRDVRVSDQGGYRFRTTSARFYVTEGRVEGLEPLQGQGPLGDIRSDAYEITEDGDVITFNGNVQMVFTPRERDDPPLEEVEDNNGQDG